MNFLKLEVDREAYTPSELGQGVTVAEMIDFLNAFEPDVQIFASHDDGDMFGNVLIYESELSRTEDFD